MLRFRNPSIAGLEFQDKHKCRRPKRECGRPKCDCRRYVSEAAPCFGNLCVYIPSTLRKKPSASLEKTFRFSEEAFWFVEEAFRFVAEKHCKCSSPSSLGSRNFHLLVVTQQSENWFPGSKACSLSMCGREKDLISQCAGSLLELPSEYSSPVLMDTLCRLTSYFEAVKVPWLLHFSSPLHSHSPLSLYWSLWSCIANFGMVILVTMVTY